MCSTTLNEFDCTTSSAATKGNPEVGTISTCWGFSSVGVRMKFLLGKGLVEVGVGKMHMVCILCFVSQRICL